MQCFFPPTSADFPVADIVVLSSVSNDICTNIPLIVVLSCIFEFLLAGNVVTFNG
jgi:hypothetical protein